MLIKLTLADKAKTEMWIDESLIVQVNRDQANPMVTAVQCKLMTPQGPVVYGVLESPDAVAAMVNNSRRGGVLN